MCSLAFVCSCASEDDVTNDDTSGADGGSEAAGGEAGSGGATSSGGSGGTTSAGGSGGTTSSGGSGGTTSTGGSGGTTSTGGTGGSGGTGGTSCEQLDFGQNDTEDTAFELQPITDCDDEGGTLEGTLAPGDVDWFTFITQDKTLCSVNPSVDVTSAENVHLCIYFECEGGSGADVACPAGSDADTSGEGRPGCCSSSSPIEPDLNCKGTLNDAARVWIEVTWPGNSNCKDYAIAYHY